MPVCVAGMHRSGTSMVAKYLHACGLYLGRDEDLMPPAAENPEGFWEHLPLVAVNDEILNRLGGAWDCPPPPVPAAAWTDGTLGTQRTRAETIIAHFVGREPWGWKDPRSSLTLPFWQALLPGLKTVVVVRNPLEVALSLRRRNGSSFALGLTLWHIHYRRLLEATAAGERLVTHYDAYFGEPQSEVRRLVRFLGLPANAAGLLGLQTTVGLRHHRLTAEDLLDAEVAPEIFALYRDLCDEAEWRDTDGVRIAQGGAARAESEMAPVATPGGAAASPLAVGLGRVSAAVIEAGVLEAELAAHKADLAAHKAVLAARDDRVAELEAAVREHEAARALLEGRVALLDAAVAERNGKIVERDGRVAERDSRIAAWGRERQAAERELAALRQTVAEQTSALDATGRQVETMSRHELELRTQLVALHEQLLHKDAEVMATLGAALARHAPNAPAGVYYRQLVEKVRSLVASRLPVGAPVAVVGLGDDEMLRLDGRAASPFPRPSGEQDVEFKTIDTPAALAQLELAQAQGVRFLVIPSPGLSWLARHPQLQRHLGERYPVAAEEPGVATVYELRADSGAAA